MTDEDDQVRIWEALYREVCDGLFRYGREDPFGKGDYFVVDDNYGWRRVTIEIHQPKMLRMEIIALLRSYLEHLPGWEVVVSVHVSRNWPVMGLTIRRNEIIDGLQRQYLPPEYQFVHYPDSRVGTGFD